MGSRIKDQYNVAVNGVGYILRGAPDKPAYQKSIVASQIDRLAISDIAYSDFSGSGLFYIAQTDWSTGAKAEKVWRDDAHFWYSSNIDAYSEQGAFKLQKVTQTENDFAEELICGAELEVDGVNKWYVGCGEDGSSYPKLYRYNSGAWGEIAGTTFGTNQNLISQVLSHKNNLWGLSVGVGASNIVKYWDTSSWTDVSGAINTAASGGSIGSCRGGAELGNTLYLICDNSINDRSHLMSTDDEGATFTEEVYLQGGGIPVAIAIYGAKVYYIMHNSNVATLRVFDPSTTSDTEVYTFYDVSMNNWGVANKYLKVFQGKLVITIPSKEIYEFDGDSVTRIYKVDETKDAISDTSADVSLYYGAVEKDNRLHWANLIYDGEYFFNSRKGDNNFTYNLFPLFADDDQKMFYWEPSEDDSVLLEDKTGSEIYKSSIANNFMMFNEMSPIVSIDKLFHSITILFDALNTGETIRVDYSIDDMANWTTLDTMTETTEDTNTKKEIIVPTTTLFNKIWVRVHLASTVATTPVIRDVILAYKPIPDYKHRWGLRLDMANSVGLLSGQKEQRTASDLEAQLWNERATKQKVPFKDIDYVECSLVSSMSVSATSARVNKTIRFPRYGRIRAVSGGVAEEMIYTSAEPDRIMGITRGVRGTRARAYTSGQTLKNDYDVYIETITSEANFTDEKTNESIAQVLLIEA